MLIQLSIRDIVLIEKLDLTFSNGLSVLTGETGAGKSILIDALSLALGARGDGGLVRSGVAEGQVTAMFDLPSDHPALAMLDARGIANEGFLILRRLQSADGRSRAFINDQPVSVAVMREVGRGLIEIHGQHDERALLASGSHRGLLDAFGGLEKSGREVAARWHDWQAKQREIEMLREQIAAARREADYLSNAVAELEALSPEPGEETALTERRQLMMQSEKIAAELNDAADILAGDASPLPALTGLAKRLERKSSAVPGLLGETVRQLDSAIEALHLAHQEIEAAQRASDFDPGDLEAVESRLFALRAAARKYSVAVENLPELTTRLGAEYEALQSGEERLVTLEREAETLSERYFSSAKALSAERQQAAALLIDKVMAELPALKLDQADFIIDQQQTPATGGPSGIDEIAFMVRTNPGTKAGPIAKIASGGELSRFLLALKVALAERGSAPTLIFDEIDTGVGGAVADAIGRRLSRLAGEVQVLSVTHAPQVAARAAHHFVIAKQAMAGEAGERMTTGVAALGGSERREEIARMLAGARITDEARAAAEQLINQSAA